MRDSNKTSKRKSDQRFEQVNLICDEIFRTLPNFAHMAILAIAWRHANREGIFRKSASELAEATNKSRRTVRDAMNDLIEGGVIVVASKGRGSIPNRYQITGEKFKLPS